MPLLTTWVVLIFTTAGVSSFASLTHSLPSEIWLELNSPLSPFSVHTWPVVAFVSGTTFKEAVISTPRIRQDAATRIKVLVLNRPLRIVSPCNGVALFRSLFDIFQYPTYILVTINERVFSRTDPQLSTTIPAFIAVSLANLLHKFNIPIF